MFLGQSVKGFHDLDDINAYETQYPKLRSFEIVFLFPFIHLSPSPVKSNLSPMRLRSSQMGLSWQAAKTKLCIPPLIYEWCTLEWRVANPLCVRSSLHQEGGGITKVNQSPHTPQVSPRKLAIGTAEPANRCLCFSGNFPLLKFDTYCTAY
ncbi:hypothetical protein AVEN_71634-1 [Araneus ventricosus]|uniref:Uncharacterized protein n=1 Tax=Araneus ventricosus TaxID=182803 RepID=A0A4Y2KHI4_ARAVE|nr:hypothetical protein AVEN_71634-1 [Araneus ventricosus]